MIVALQVFIALVLLRDAVQRKALLANHFAPIWSWGSSRLKYLDIPRATKHSLPEPTSLQSHAFWQHHSQNNNMLGTLALFVCSKAATCEPGLLAVASENHDRCLLAPSATSSAQRYICLGRGIAQVRLFRSHIELFIAKQHNHLQLS